MRRFYVYLQLSIACTFSLALWMNAARAVSSAPGVHTGLPSEIPALSDAILADTIPPVIICPPNDTLILDPGLCDTVYTYTVTAMDSLMPIVPSQLGGLASGEAVPIGTTTNTFLAVDTAGNSATCFFSVTVQPATYIISCRDTTHVYLGGDCTVSVMPTEALYSPYGCPDGFVLEADQTPPFGDGPWEAPFFDAADRGKNLGLRVTDNSTGEKCFSVVHIQDTIAPVLDCPAVHVPCALPNGDLTPEFLKDSLGISAGMPTLTENCPNLLAFNHVDVHQDFPCDSPGTITGIITRFWTVLDASGNLATCVQTINRHRDLDNVLFPADTLISCAQDTVPAVTGGPYIQVNNRRYNLLTAPFCEIQATYTDSIAPLCGGSRRLYRTWMVRDACRPDTVGNPVLGMQEIEIEDDRALSLDCPPEVIVQVQTSGCLGTVDLPDIVVRDTCSWVTQVQVFWSVDGVPDTLTASLSDFPGNDPASSDTMAVFGMVSDFPAGQTNLRYVATDACGNTASCDLTLTVWDSIPPAAQCDSSLVVFLDDQGRATIPASLADGGSADSCGNVFFKIYRDLAGTCDTLGNQLDDMLNFCCADLGDTVLAVLRVYDVPVPAGIVPDSLAAGQYSECTVPVQIRDDNAPQCQPPADIQVLCADFDPALDTYGQPIPSCRVDSVFTAVDYTQFDTLCRQGVIERTFQVFDATGISGQCTQTITVNNEQFYYVRFPDDLSITMCDTSGNYGEPELFGVVCEKMDVSMEEAVVFQVPDACFRIERTWTIINWCTYNPNEPLIEVPNPNPNALPIHPDNLPGPVVSEPGADSPWTATVVKINPGDPNPTDYSTFWMADANGYTYKQVIKVIDIEQPVFIDCPDTSVVFVDSSANDFFLWNGNYSPDPGNPDQDLCEGNAPVQVTITDACFGPDLGVDFLLFLDLDEDGMQESVVSSTDLPAAGTIRYNNINNPNYSGGDAKLFDFRPVVPNDKYQFSVQADTSGRNLVVRLAWNTSNAPGQYIAPQLPLGDHRIRWTVYDGCGNESTCEHTFRVENPDGVCAPTVVVVGGTIETEEGDGVANVAVQLDGNHPNLASFSLFDLTDAQGKFNFDVPTNSAYVVTPVRNDSHINGVSTFDLLLINKHVLALTLLGSPYKIIAADANHSGSVTTFDIVELRKLVLGLYTQLPSNTAWRFVPVGFAFNDPANPFQGGFPEHQTVASLQQNNLPMHDFVAIKVGDVNGNAAPGVSSQEPDYRNAPVLYLDLPDRTVQAGERFSVPIKAAEGIAGVQFTLDFPGLEVEDLLPGPGFTPEHYAVYNRDHRLTVSWDVGGQPGFTLQLKALQSGRLRDMLQLSNSITFSEAYSSALEPMQVALRFDGEHISAPGFELYPNRPNPFGETTDIRFFLPEQACVNLRVWTQTGEMVLDQQKVFPAGSNVWPLHANALGGGSGLLYYEVVTGTDRAVGKMLWLGTGR